MTHVALEARVAREETTLMAHHHFPFIVVPIGLAAFYVVREFLQAGATRWGDIAQRFANSTPPEDGWERLPFLWVEWTKDRALRRATSGRSRMTLNVWGQFGRHSSPRCVWPRLGKVFI